MEKIYKFDIPQNKEVESANVRIEDGKVFVNVEFKEKFEPKDGDFCVDCFGNTFILFEDGNLGMNHGSYALFYKDGEKWYFQRNNMTRAVRFATPEEKAAFLARLEKECNKRWNAEKKCLEDIYVPKFGDIVRVDLKEDDVSKGNYGGYMVCIYPNVKEFIEENDFFNIANLSADKGIIYFAGSYVKSVKKASESEKQELFEKLAEVGKRWNPETNKLENVRWRAKHGNKYFVVSDLLEVLCYKDYRNSTDNTFYKLGNYFRTPESAQKVADQIKEIFKNSEV